ncbi:MAG TPA: sn-glycerol-3-phosphate ABC transporter ATP-binding protein UgpC [Solirubrobacteraceae bacterium]|nr:sn-glycerol-3-phosphate ABC transporter ATP-binding protein UgpC [Solirubrobacteraceae bacterium]
MASLSLEQVSKTYPGGVQAVSGLDLDVADGEFVVLVGPSGCGKTTVLRMVAGLEEITSGTISLDGKEVNDLSSRDRDVAMVFQNYALYPHLSVHQNIAFSLSVRRVPKDERDRRVREAAALLGLTDLLNTKPRALSGGQRQRVAMGRALVREPSVFLMDEPLSNLDARLRVQMRTEVLRVQRRLGVATLYVTHDQTEAMTMGDRVAVMRAGELQQLAVPRELYERPVNMFVAAFMGSPAMNLYETSLTSANGAPALQLGNQLLALPPEITRARPALVNHDGGLVVGIRPEHLSPNAADANGHALLVDVELVEALGNEQLVHFAIPDSRSPDETEARTGDSEETGTESAISGGPTGRGVARVGAEENVTAGTRVPLAVDIRRLHFFDRASGAALS